MNRLGEVGRVTPCAPSLARHEIVVAVVGAQRTARPTFIESFKLQEWTPIRTMNSHGVAQPSAAATSDGLSPPELRGAGSSANSQAGRVRYLGNEKATKSSVPVLMFLNVFLLQAELLRGVQH